MYRILYPIVVPYMMYKFWKTATPEQKAELRSKTTTDERKNEINMQIFHVAFPNIEIA
jgi:hypothetical protein